MGAVRDDMVEESIRLVREAEALGVQLRLLGGVAVSLRCPSAMRRPELARSYRDMDYAAPRRSAAPLRQLFVAQGYSPDVHFNALHGASRLLFRDEDRSRQIDVFLGSFQMCHKLDLEARVAMSGPALSPSDLLLLKLQIVQLNPKDVTDAIALLLDHMPVEEDRADTLSTEYIARLCARDWGWFTTVHDNLQVVAVRARGLLSSSSDAVDVEARIGALLGAMDSAPKSLRWRLRDRIGRRMAWYELPEEVG